jgi:hypothetical protein
MIGDHQRRTAARATLLVTAVDEILGTHRVGGIGAPPVDPGQRRRPVPGYRPDRDTHPGQVRGQGAADLAGAEHHMQPILTHDQVLSTALE